MGVISNGTTLLDNGALDSGVSKGALTLIQSQTASSSANISFTSNIDSTYKKYIFKFIDIHPATDNVNFLVNFRDGGSSYDATKQSTSFAAYQNEVGDTESVNYEASFDLSNSTAVQPMNAGGGIGGQSDESIAGTLVLYNPSDTTHIKHFLINTHFYNNSDYAISTHIAGYCNVTAAIDGVQFTFSSGNIDAGTIKMYGVT
jgi:hypothetical protein|tara:strand:+ start:663 stop:1268 length:606 start_codon:yes stop_codon:yes gene_type:complete